jgi:hypothetical protein
MLYKAKVPVCSEICTQHSTQSEHNVEFLNVNPFRSYIGPRPTVWFSSSAPMSEDVRYGFFVAFVRPLSESVRRFSSCSTDFSQQIAQVVLILFLHVFLF